MKYLYIILAAVAVFLVIGACKGTKKSTVASAKTQVVQLKKGKCFGKCRVYSFTVFEDHSLSFVGSKNVENIGAYSANISNKVYAELVAHLNAAQLSELDNEYLSSATDLPETRLTYKGKTIRFHNRNAPEELKQLVIMLDEIAFAQAWETEKQQK